MLLYFPVCKPQRKNTNGSTILITLLIVFDRLRRCMRIAIDLDCETKLGAIKIENIASDAILPPKTIPYLVATEA